MAQSLEPLPLPEHPLLRAWASVLNEAGNWANVLDAQWRYVFVTDELRLSYRDMGAATMPLIRAHFFSAQVRQFIRRTLGGAWASPEVGRAWFLDVGRYVLAETPGGREELRRVVDPELADLVDELQPQDLPPVWINRSGFSTAGAEATGRRCGFESTTATVTVSVFASCRSPRRECRISPGRPRPRT